ncbi:lytic transglycosylase domain-containing protein [Myxococcota bacterium]|nr:lytic transglycosylase domain-containing protein [Myxococcota bacterium]
MRIPFFLILVGILLGVLTQSSLAHAELYSWEDKDGVIHFSNIPRGGPKKAKAVKGKTNAWEFKDDLGKLRRIHRVDVTRYDAIIREAANYYSLPAALIKAVIATESAFEPSAISKAGAQGLMQLMPPTARDMHVTNSFDPRDNIYGGTRYLRLMANRFEGDLRFTIASYNAGPAAVKRYKGVPPYEETQDYVRRVLTLYRHYLKTWETKGH